LELLTLAWVLQDAIFVGKEVGLVMVIGCRLGPAKVIILVLAEYKLTVFRTFSDSVILIVIVSCFNHRLSSRHNLLFEIRIWAIWIVIGACLVVPELHLEESRLGRRIHG